jgi:hypothetical protein
MREISNIDFIIFGLALVLFIKILADKYYEKYGGK